MRTRRKVLNPALFRIYGAGNNFTPSGEWYSPVGFVTSPAPSHCVIQQHTALTQGCQTSSSLAPPIDLED